LSIMKSRSGFTNLLGKYLYINCVEPKFTIKQKNKAHKEHRSCFLLS